MPMPSHSPLYPPLPHQYRGVRWLTIVCEVDEARVAPLLPAPLEGAGAPNGRLRVEVFAGHYKETPYGEYTEAGVIVPSRYHDVLGQSFLFLYLDNVGAICAGRELIGFPKKDGDVTFSRAGDRVRGTVVRGGHELLRVEADLVRDAERAPQVERLPLGPRLQVREIPRADGPGFDLRQVFRKDMDLDMLRVHERLTGHGRAVLSDGPDDPIGQLAPLDVLGAVYVALDFGLASSQVLHTEVAPSVREAARGRVAA